MDNNEYSKDEAWVDSYPAGLPHTFSHAIAKTVAWAWRLRSDRRAVASLLGRYGAHLGVVVLVATLLTLGRITLTQVSVANVPDSSMLQVVAEPVATPTALGSSDVSVRYAPVVNDALIVRQALPYTILPERVRLEVITYTVQPGDTIYGIAEHYELSPYTIVWANLESLQGSPWLIQPGMTLFILPVDGAYHTVAVSDTVESIAETYEIATSTLYNVWNLLDPEQPLRQGQLLVLPGGAGPDFEWEPPPPVVTVQAGRMVPAATSYSGAVDVSMTGASGWFGLPTGSYAVSGWYFHDSRNPTHIGLDYKCRLGDPIYASDNGIVTFSGWSGGYGQMVQVDHGNGFVTRYAHFDSLWVVGGQFVSKGEVLGACGTTGWSTGPHLHYEIRYNGVPQNPQLYEP